MGLLDGTLDRNAGANYDKPIAIMMFPTYITLSCNLWGADGDCSSWEISNPDPPCNINTYLAQSICLSIN